MAFGLTTEGFIPKTLADVRTSLRARWRGVFGEDVNVEEESRNGQEIDILSEAISEPWSLLESIYHALEPGGAGGQLLDSLLSLAGLTRKAATKTRVSEVLTGDEDTIVPAGSVLSTTNVGTRFESLADSAEFDLGLSYASLANGATITAGAFYRVDDGGTDRIYVVLTTGNVGTPKQTPSGTSRSITVGTAVVAFVGDGEAYAAGVLFDAEDTGPKPAYAYTLTEIETPVTGWSGAANLVDHDPLGTDQETDPAARLRREASVAAPGLSPLDALRAAILAVQGVTSCTVFENTLDVTVGNMTPHTIEALVEGGADQAIVNAIGRQKTGGLGMVGTSSGTYTDEQGNAHTMRFSRPAAVNIYVAVPLKKDPDLYPTDGDNQVKLKIVELGNALALGRDVVASQLEAFVWSIPGVTDVGPVLIRTSSPPIASTTIELTTRQRAAYDTSRITVTATDSET